MHGCGDQWCFNPWDWIMTRIMLALAYYGAEDYAGSPAGDGTGGA